MKPYATIKLFLCYGCSATCGPQAGKFMRLDDYVTIHNKRTKRVWLCFDCIKEIKELQLRNGNMQRRKSE